MVLHIFKDDFLYFFKRNQYLCSDIPSQKCWKQGIIPSQKCTDINIIPSQKCSKHEKIHIQPSERLEIIQ